MTGGEALMPRGERPPGLLRLLAEDLRTIAERDPSIRGRREALLHPVLPAMWLHGSPTCCTGAAGGCRPGC